MSLGRLVLGEEAPLPCTPRGIVALCRRYEVELAGARSRSWAAASRDGHPLGLLLTRRSEKAR